jgi:hypothetical protein
MLQFSGPFNLVTDSGNVLMMPPELIDAINAESKLSFIAYVESVSTMVAPGDWNIVLKPCQA